MRYPEEIQQQVVAAMQPFLGVKFGNPSSIHKLGRQASEAMDGARSAVARLLGVDANQIYFAPSALYADNVAILGRARFCEVNELPRTFALVGDDDACLQQLRENGWRTTLIDPRKPGWREVLAAIRAETTCVHMQLTQVWNEAGDAELLGDIDTISFSASRLYAPLSIAALVVKRGVNIMPVVFGGGQEFGFFPGTEPIAGIVGFGKAAEVWSSLRIG